MRSALSVELCGRGRTLTRDEAGVQTAVDQSTGAAGDALPRRRRRDRARNAVRRAIRAVRTSWRATCRTMAPRLLPSYFEADAGPTVQDLLTAESNDQDERCAQWLVSQRDDKREGLRVMAKRARERR